MPAAHSIDFSSTRVVAIRTEPGKPEERQELLPGGKGMAVCTWADGTAFQSDVPNLTLTSRAKDWSKIPAVPKKRPASAKGKAQAAPKAKAAQEEASTELSEEDTAGDEEVEEEEVSKQKAQPKKRALQPNLKQDTRAVCERRERERERAREREREREKESERERAREGEREKEREREREREI